LDSGLQSQFQKAGLLHVLVASGAQVSLLAGLVTTACRRFRLAPTLRWLVTFVIVALFCGMSGGGVAIVRASLMAMTALTLQLGFRKTHPLHVLSVTGLLVVLLSPTSIWDIGAQLSFAATAGLIILARPLEDKLPMCWPGVVRTLVATTMAPYLATLPILWIHTHTVSLVSIVSNIVVLAWLEFMVTAGFFLTLLGVLMQPLTVGIGTFFELALVLLDRLTAWFSDIPGGQFHTPSPPLFLAFGLYGVLAAWLWMQWYA
jgi:competence protein ComEC